MATPDQARLDRIVAEARRNAERRDNDYREFAGLQSLLKREEP